MNLGYFFISPAFINFPLLARLSAFLLAAHCPLFGRNLGAKTGLRSLMQRNSFIDAFDYAGIRPQCLNLSVAS